MNFRGHQGRRGRVEATLELTPLIDVIFLLLIFFVMTTTPAMNVVERLDLELPDAGSGAAVDDVDEMQIALRVYRDGTVMIREGEDGEPRRVDDLEAELEQLRATHRGASIWIQGDVEATHGTVIDILDGARQVGFDRVRMAVQPR